MPQVFIRLRCKLGQVQGIERNLRTAYGFHQSHLKGVGQAHHLAGGFHLGAQVPLGVHKFIKGPFGEFYRHIIQRRLKGRVSLSGDGVPNLVQSVADGDFRSHLGDGIARGFRGQGGGTGHAGIYLDDCILKGGWMQSKLHVASAFHSQLSHDFQSSCTKHLEFLIGKGDCGSDNDTVSRMHAHRIHIFHGAHGDCVASAVPDDLEFNLFPA